MDSDDLVRRHAPQFGSEQGPEIAALDAVAPDPRRFISSAIAVAMRLVVQPAGSEQGPDNPKPAGNGITT